MDDGDRSASVLYTLLGVVDVGADLLGTGISRLFELLLVFYVLQREISAGSDGLVDNSELIGVIFTFLVMGNRSKTASTGLGTMSKSSLSSP